MNNISNHLVKPKIIMVETSHPGNIGAAARAMKTMTLEELILVAPKSYPDPVAFARSSGAADVLDRAKVCDSLTNAISHCQIVVGITARSRKLSAPVVTPKQLVEKMNTEYGNLQVGWVFGRERNGLSNEEIDLCNLVCSIPANPEYGSLNIAAAIQILCYEWHSGLQHDFGFDDSQQTAQKEVSIIASADDREGFYHHLWQTLDKIEFSDPSNPMPVQRKLRRIFDRAQLSREEINILRGILKNVIKQ